MDSIKLRQLMFVIAFVLTVFLLYQMFVNERPKHVEEIIIIKDVFNESELHDIKEHIRVYDLRNQSQIEAECLKTKIVREVQTTICIHDVQRDRVVSKMIKNGNLWEEQQINLFLRMMEASNDIHLLDFGAQIGEFTLFAAKYGRKVVAVEPFYENYVRLHKAALFENTQDRIKLITNGISDKRGEIKRLSFHPNTTGGQSIFLSQNNNSSQIEINIKNDPFIIETIILDDLITVLPKDFKRAVIKMDIEGMELKGIKGASKLFEVVDVLALMMEWIYGIRRWSDEDINEFLDFMYARNYKVSNPLNLNPLDRADVRKWPVDILWLKKDFKF